MEVINGIKVWGIPDIETVNQMKSAVESSPVHDAALMADHHIGYSVPIGGVIAYDSHVCVNGVGFDIACGNKAVMLDISGDEARDNIYRTMNEVQKQISFGIGRKNTSQVDHELFEDPLWQEMGLLQSLKQKAKDQLGTVGGGNHYVDIFTDELDRVWVGVHFGSRGFGHSIATHFLKQAGGVDGVHAAPVVLHETSDLGEQYLKCMALAGRYAYAGRDWVCSKVASILRADILQEIHNHHNFAWKETHKDKEVWVVRKGATPNWPGVQSFVGGSMGDFSYILEGVDSDESKESMYSTIHGAGRVLGRMQAKGKIKNNTVIREPLVSQKDMRDWIEKFGIELRGSDVDEAPQCYRRITEVLHAHRNTVKVIHELKPIGVCMADKRDYDPYKD